jgi:hypothetical protein
MTGIAAHHGDRSASQPEDHCHQHSADRHENRHLEQVAHDVVHAAILPIPEPPEASVSERTPAKQIEPPEASVTAL